MREFEYVFDKGLKVGLSPEDNLPSHLQALFDAYGFRCGREWLEGYEVKDCPLPAAFEDCVKGLHFVWPFPQMLIGKKYHICVVRDPVNDEDAIYLISEDNLTATHIFSVDALTFGTGTIMEMADFGLFCVLANGVITVKMDPTFPAWIADIATDTMPLVRTVCNFNGQLVGGGVTSDWYDCDEKFIVWSRIGEFNCVPDRKNTAGYRRDLFGGDIYHTRKLDNTVIVYSSKGVTLMYPVGSPAATFGFKELYDNGPINRGAMATSSDYKKHVFVDEELNLCKVTSDGVEVLGYHSFMEELNDTGEDIIVNYDPGDKDFYIGNSTKTFLLSPYGLTEIQQHPSAVWRAEPGRQKTYVSPDTIDEDFEPLIQTSSFDMNYRGHKTIFTVECSAMISNGMQASVGWANDLYTWAYTDWVIANDAGVAPIIINGADFVLRVKFSAVYEMTRVSFIKARYKMTDMRSLRGVYAPPPRGQ